MSNSFYYLVTVFSKKLIGTNSLYMTVLGLIIMPAIKSHKYMVSCDQYVDMSKLYLTEESLISGNFLA